MGEYKIEKDVTIESVARKPKYPFDEMEVGDSFVLPINKHQTIRTYAHYWSKRHKNGKVKFTVRKTDDGNCRCWRIK